MNTAPKAIECPDCHEFFTPHAPENTRCFYCQKAAEAA